ncbi:hypothetical protein [Acidithrix sp. C25]|uniref:hypothetical protein n=1 Tax=Acidithrix sp. C25 TaxID=1671482 RepID=UPI00191BB222|nr:hypothetical protein [Acidithrix sp. C25]
MVDLVLRVAGRAGIYLEIPEDVQGVCCSQPWSHNGYEDGASVSAIRRSIHLALDSFWRDPDYL